MEPRKFLFLMDPLQTLNLATETSLLLINELMDRGHQVHWTEISDLILDQNELFAEVREIRPAGSPLALGDPICVSVGEMDALLVRPDPPFNETFLHLTYLLDFVPDHVVQFNPGTALRAYNEKLTMLRFSNLAPPTLTTMNLRALEGFLRKHSDIIIKPLGECSGRGIERVTLRNKERLSSLLVSDDGTRRFVTAQKFLKAIKDGDKRVYLAGGEPVGMVNRVPSEGSYLGNIHQGAKCEATQLTPKEESAIKTIRPFLEEHGIFLVGLDFIDEQITEINITSPSAVRQINEVTGLEVHKEIVAKMLNRMGQARPLTGPKRCCSVVHLSP
jgi:glutathione synthase